MRAFHTIAVPHADILEGRLGLDVFAADLWEVFQGRATEEYRDPAVFFRKTHPTRGLRSLENEVRLRLQEGGGNPVIQLQTPFGGGKTHALITLFHRAPEWGARRVVLVGTALKGDVPLWQVLEDQLPDGRPRLAGPTAPGREALRAVLEPHQPLLILVDELLEYVTKAAAIRVGETTMAAQALAFVQELTETIASLPRACAVVTLPSSVLEHYDETAERFFQQLQKIAGRVELVFTPVAEDEVASVIRRRLFAHVDEAAAAEIVDAYLDYAVREGLVPAGTEPAEYRRRFLASYPFLPEVVDVLYHRWGSFHTFQRTRGVLRLLALVVYHLRHSDRPYITLADFDLSNAAAERVSIRHELLKHIGSEYNSVLAADITDAEAGSRKADAQMGDAYRGLRLATRAATTIFLHSFSGGPEKGARMGDIKRHCAPFPMPSAAVADAVELLRGRLWYLQVQQDRYFFTNQGNLNMILLARMETVRHQTEELKQEEQRWLERSLRSDESPFGKRVYVWPSAEQADRVENTPSLSLVVLRRKDEALMRRLVESRGASPRVYKNALVFLYPAEGERPSFDEELQRLLAATSIDQDVQKGLISLSSDQRQDLQEQLRKLKEALPYKLRLLYRMVAVPTREGFRELDLGIPTVGDSRGLAREVYDKLRAEQEIVESLHPAFVVHKYLRDRSHVSTADLYDAPLRTPGEPRWTGRSVVERAIVEGVKMGLFALGELSGETVRILAFRREAVPTFAENEVLVRAEAVPPEGEPAPTRPEPAPAPSGPEEPPAFHRALTLSLTPPKGTVSSLLGVLHYLQSKFDRLEVVIRCRQGQITQSEIEDRVVLALRQAGIPFSFSVDGDPDQPPRDS